MSPLRTLQLQLPLLICASLVCLSGPGCRRAGEDTPRTEPQSKPPSPAQASTSAVAFADVTALAGVDFTHYVPPGSKPDNIANILVSDGAGGAILDYDGDGWMDLYLVNSGPVEATAPFASRPDRFPNGLFRNRGDGAFENVTIKAGVAGQGFGITAAAADYDNDGDTDLLVVNFGGLILYQNQGNGVFKDVTASAGLTSKQAGISATFLDIEGDGFLDLFVGNYLVYDPSVKTPPGSQVPYPGPLSYEAEFNIVYRNRGDGTFEDVSASSGVHIPGHRAMSVTSLDFDRDGDPDLYVSNDGTANLLLVNDGKGRFKDEALLRGVALNAAGVAEGSMGAVLGDCNGDGLSDMLVTRFGAPSFYVNSHRGYYDDRAPTTGILQEALSLVAWGGCLIDFENDGDLDIFMATGDPHFMKGMRQLLLENSGGGRYSNAGSAGAFQGLVNVNARGCAAFDIDNDGRLDLVLTVFGGKAVLLRNQTPSKHHWLTIKLEGTHSNREAFGSRVRVTAGTKALEAEGRCPTSYLFQQDPRLHFGLGDAAVAEQIEVRWPDGRTQVLTNVAADQILTIREAGEARWPERKRP